MRGSAAFRTAVAPGGALAGPWVKNELWRRAREVPSLDLQFADNKSLIDAVTGQSLVTFTRASSGTYVGSDGVLRTATTNLCLQSQDFSTTWTNFNSTESVNTAVAPDGTITADTLIPSNGATSGLIRQDFSGSAFTDNASISFSIFVKAAGLTNFNIQFFNKANTFYGTQTINASTGALSGSGTLATTAVTPVGDGWFRVSATGMNSGSGATGPNIRFVVTSTGDGTSGIYLWGAQLEQSSTVGEYIPTTSTINSAPRFDHNPATGESLGLLVEESRTNLLLRSEELGDAAWTTAAATVTSNTGVAPDGSSTADTITSSGTAVISQAVTKAASAITYTGSLFVKGTITALSFSIDDGATTNRGRVVFNLSTGAISSTSNDGTFTGTSGTITSFLNGWYRLAITTTTNSTTSVRLRPFWTGSGTSIDAWGAQLETGAFGPTSYIPTTTATVTRSADVASITGSNFSSWYRQDEGTVFAEAAVAQPVAGGNQFVFRTSDNTYNNAIALNIPGQAQLSTASGGIFDGSASSVANLVANVSAKIGTAYASNNLGLSLNGAIAVTDTSATIPTALNRADIGSDHVGVNRVKAGTIRRLVYWGKRLPNSVLQAITQ